MAGDGSSASGHRAAEGSLTTGGIIALIVIAVAALIGALLGGLAGMHFHRKVDKAGLGK